jgi:uncharacterized protein
MNRILWTIVWCLFFSAAYAASYECDSAKTEIARMVCDNQEVNVLDFELDNKVKALLADANDKTKQRLNSEQTQWLKHSRDVCKDDNCLLKAYLSRLTTLDTGIRTTVTPVTGKDTKTSVAKKFNQDVRQLGMQNNITSCDYVISMVNQVTTSKNVSYGAICAINFDNKVQRLAICNDNVVGKLTVAASTGYSYKDVARFTAKNCPSGG